MRHPRCIAERRHNRVTVMARRRKVIRLWYSTNNTFKPEDNRAWYRCAKWNLNCGSMLCHGDKYFTPRRQRRRQLQRDIAENVASWSLSCQPRSQLPNEDDFVHAQASYCSLEISHPGR